MLMVLALSIDRIFRGGTETYWVVLSTLMFIAFSLSESTILQQNDISWVMFVATSANRLSLLLAQAHNLNFRALELYASAFQHL